MSDTPRTDRMFDAFDVILDMQNPGIEAVITLSRTLERELKEARGALADIAFSDDMTLEVARRKAARIYNKLRVVT